MAPEFTRYLPHLSLGAGQHGAVVGRLFHLVRRIRLGETLLEISKTVRSYCAALSPQHDEPHRSIELGYLVLRQRPRDLLGQAEARYPNAFAIAFLDVVIDVDIAVADHDVTRQFLETIADIAWNEAVPVDVHPRRLELLQ
jgi:hypothetical protein